MQGGVVDRSAAMIAEMLQSGTYLLNLVNKLKTAYISEIGCFPTSREHTRMGKRLLVLCDKHRPVFLPPPLCLDYWVMLLISHLYGSEGTWGRWVATTQPPIHEESGWPDFFSTGHIIYQVYVFRIHALFCWERSCPPSDKKLFGRFLSWVSLSDYPLF